ncbi:AraC family transcriptional regulator [Paenibacillus selenitireducens]|uniref:AraC family transcriptional regulator n=1 Tax=Paenibacillus selenitireducens TaxID=1324314 RepID=A0A1T2XIH2_9BACL|nr:helix-turn-helix domain-containing protein [Paenibacillus selenitireducens]OPA79443.1 AraC family transcriptional regulator [Paenibacillus selenitireducens]
MKWSLRWLGFRHLKSVWITMVISNLVMLLIPLSIGVFLYSKVEDSLEKGANRSNQAMLEQLKLSLDTELKEVDKLAQQIVFDPKLDYLLKLKEDQSGFDRYKFIEFMGGPAFRSNLRSNFILDYYVYFRKSDLVLKSGLLTDSRKFYDMYYSYEGMTYEAWRDKVLHGFHTMEYLPSATLLRRSELDPMKSIENTPLDVITFTQSLPGRDRKDITGSFVILIDESRVKEMFAQIEYASDSSIYVVDGEGRSIMSTEREPLPPSLLRQIHNDEGLFNEKLNGDSKVVSFTSSEKEGWKYILVTPRSVYMQQLNLIQEWTLILFLLCLAIGLIAAVIIAYRNYSPLRKAVDIIPRGAGWKGRHAVNEYELIQRTIADSLQEEQNLRNLLARQTPVLRSNYLSRLIRGQMDVDTTEKGVQSLQFMDITFISEYFSVMIIQLDSIARFHIEHDEQQWALARFIISNVGTDMIQAPHQTFAVELDRDRVVFLNNFAAERASEMDSDIQEMAESLKHMIEDRFHIDITVSVGLPHVGAKSIGESYAEAVAAMEYRIIKGGGTIIYFRDITNVHSHYYYPIDIEVQLINFVRSGDMENVLKLLDTIYAMNFESGSITPEVGRCLFFNMTSTFLKIMNTTGTDQRDILGPDIDLIKDIFSYETAESMYRRIQQLYEMLTGSFVIERTDHRVQLLQDMEQFLDENFTDPNLGLVMISDRFGMTPQYISTFYKKCSGMNVIDSITRRRIQQAKIHMRTKEMTNAQLAQLVGYTSDVVFIRAFKKIEGVTPGKYRENFQTYTSDEVG